MNRLSLPTRPRAETYSVGDILQLARTGKLRVPSFQTGLRWDRRHVADLFDSIVRGFPIGGLLLWRRPARAARVHFGPVEVDAPELGEALDIVDGQQRVTALVAALCHPEADPPKDRYALWVDLVTGMFEVPTARPGSSWIPVALLGDRRRLQAWARAAAIGDQTEELVTRAFDLEERIIRYMVTAYTVEVNDDKALRLIFERVNNSGVPLKESEVFDALFPHGGEKPLQALAADLDAATGFGTLSESWLLRCVKAIAGLEARRSFTEAHPPGDALLGDTRASLTRAITFLQTDAGFLHQAILPYRFPLIVLARLFHLHPRPQPRSLRLLARWVWRGALAKVHGDSSHATVDAHLAELGEDEHEAVQSLLRRVPAGGTPPSPMLVWNGGAAASRLYAAAMVRREPVAPESGAPRGREELLAALSARDLGELFRPPPSIASDVIAARVLWSGRAKLGALLDDELRSLCIDDAAAAALRAGDGAAFVAARAAHLQGLLEDDIQTFAVGPEGDRPPIRVLAQAG